MVAAHDDHHLAVSGGAAVGGSFDATPVLSWTSINHTTEAYIAPDASVVLPGDVLVSATGKEHLTVVVAGVAVGSGSAFDASVAYSHLDNTVHAYIGEGAVVTADGNVAVIASDDTTGTFVGGDVAIGAAEGALGATYLQVDIVKSTIAEIQDNAQVTGLGNSSTTIDVIDGSVSGTTVGTGSIVGVVVQARSSETLTSVSFAGGGGEFAGLMGAGTYTHVNSDTTARVGSSASLNADLTGAAAGQAVNIGASNVADVTNWAGGLSAGAVFIGGAVDVGIIRNDTTALVAEDALVKANGDVDVLAVSARKARSHALSAGLGLGGIAGAVSVWTLGREVTSTYKTGGSDDQPNGVTGDALAVSGGSKATATTEMRRRIAATCMRGWRDTRTAQAAASRVETRPLPASRIPRPGPWQPRPPPLR